MTSADSVNSNIAYRLLSMEVIYVGDAVMYNVPDPVTAVITDTESKRLQQTITPINDCLVVSHSYLCLHQVTVVMSPSR